MNSNETQQECQIIDGKLGLCLSGGGFRAALYHIGTLVALAERGLLHQVEVLSTVSGGSIIGAYYYLKVKQLLEGKRPGCPLPSAVVYLDIVQEIERDFVAAVQKNVRLRLFLNPYATARMLLEEEYSRSDRLSDLLNELFYNDISLVDKIHLNDIHITPLNAEKYIGTKGIFDVDLYNKSEICKIPVLTLNATCLNTGHPFHFTGSWVGEPQRNNLYPLEQNTNCILPQMRFDGRYQEKRGERVADWQRKTLDSILLSDAVAASSAVPGLFPPLPIHNLYRNDQSEEIVVELSDGGVFDNQGLDALFAANCTHLIVSDASGQLEDEQLLPTDILSAGMRANNVMMERIRGYGYVDLVARGEADKQLSDDHPLRKEISLVKISAFTHLRELAANTPAMPAIPGPVDRQGGVVYRLSGIRTDFDSFSDMEAYTLMYQGYALAQDKLVVFCSSSRAQPLRPWCFLEIRDVIKNDLSRLTKHLTVGKEMLFKSFRLAPVASWACLLIIMLITLSCPAVLLWGNWNTPVMQQPVQVTVEGNNCCCSTIATLKVPPATSSNCKTGIYKIPTISLPSPTITWGGLSWYLLVLLLGALPLSPTMRKVFKVLPWLHNAKTSCAMAVVSNIGIVAMTVLALVVSVAVLITLNTFNKIFLNAGKLKS
jgi:NTE family protein